MTEKDYRFFDILEEIVSELTLIRKALQIEKAPNIIQQDVDGTITIRKAMDLESYFEAQEDDGK